MRSDTPHGVADDTSRDGAEGVPSRVVVESFHSKGKLLPPALGPLTSSTRVHSFYGGGETVMVSFGEFGHSTEIWTTLKGLADLIGDLGATLSRAQIAREKATSVAEFWDDYSDLPS